MKLDVVLTAGPVRFPVSSLAPAGSAPEGIIPVTAVRDADPDACPPEIRTASGATLFVSAERRAELEGFCTANRIPRRSRPDVWGDLLEPFLDAEFTPERRDAARERLGRAGLDADGVAAIRAEVAPLMQAYNALHQDWFHLGLADLLNAANATWIPEHQRIDVARRAAFHAWAMKIADLGHSHDTP